MSSTVAIIMRAKDEMPHVQRTLRMLQRQTFREYDLIAIDSGSEDGTFEVLEKTCKPEHLDRIKSPDYSPGRVINSGIERSDHPFIVLLNADAVPMTEDFIEQLIHPLQDGTADAVYARQTARPEARFIVAYDYERAYDPGRMQADFFSAAACAFTASLWRKNRFREEGYAEDLAWAKVCLAGGARFRFIPDAVVEHSHNYTLRALYRKRYRQALTFGSQPDRIRQISLCMRELARDFLHAGRKLQLHTIPYNIAYRITIHAAMYRAMKDRFSAPS